MPPKNVNKQAKAVDKAKAAAKAKAVEDKTFGLKNKNKSNKVQQYVKGLEKAVAASKLKTAGPTEAKKDKKAAEAQRQKELNDLFAVAIKQPKVPLGVDPKSMVCEYFRAGQCTKGFKCKFSHDLNVERKGQKIDIFSDRRDGDDGEEGMEDWDQEQLEKVVNEKHGAEKPSNKTEIICKFFLDAVERKQYGWFWTCPNGKECKYRHALPPGYVLKSQMKELLEEEAAGKKAIEDVIEEERAKVDAKTPITQAVFAQWHADKQAAARKAREDSESERFRKGVLTGRELFMQEGFEVEDDLGATDDYVREDNEEEMIRQMEAAARAAAQAAWEAEGRAKEAAAQNGAAASGAEAADGAPGPSTEAPSSSAGPSAATANGNGNGAAPKVQLSKEDEELFFDDDDEDEDFEDDELDELEASLGATKV